MATFHPELTSDSTVHEYFLKLAAEPAARNNETRRTRTKPALKNAP